MPREVCAEIRGRETCARGRACVEDARCGCVMRLCVSGLENGCYDVMIADGCRGRWALPRMPVAGGQGKMTYLYEGPCARELCGMEIVILRPGCRDAVARGAFYPACRLTDNFEREDAYDNPAPCRKPCDDPSPCQRPRPPLCDDLLPCRRPCGDRPCLPVYPRPPKPCPPACPRPMPCGWR